METRAILMETARDPRVIPGSVAERGLRERLGERLRSARADAGLLQQGLAVKLGVSRASVASIEAGKQSITVEQLIRIANLLGTHPADLLRDVLDESGPASKELDRLPDAHKNWINQVKKEEK